MRKLALTASFLLGACGAADKAAELQAQADALETEYEGLNLSCDFDDITAQSDAEKDQTATTLVDDAAASSTSSTCTDAAQQYAVLVDQFDGDGDGKLSDSELADAEAGWDDAQQKNVDADGDGKVSDAEKKKW